MSSSPESRLREIAENHRRYAAAASAANSLQEQVDTLIAMIPAGSRDDATRIGQIRRKCHVDIECLVAGYPQPRILPSQRIQKPFRSSEVALKAFGAPVVAEAPRVAFSSSGTAAKTSSILAVAGSSRIREPSHNPNIAANVFGVPEVLEQILSYLSPSDLLGTYRVNKAFFDTLDGSPQVRKALGLKSAFDSYYFSPIERLCQSSSGRALAVCTDETTADHDRGTATHAELRNQLSTSRSCAPGVLHLGARCEQMLVVQPPLRKMHLYAHYCTRPPIALTSSNDTPNFSSLLLQSIRSATTPTETITSATGITLGQVVAAISRIKRTHLLCPSAAAHECDADGYVRCTVTADGTLPLKENDPMLHEKRASQQQKDEREKRETERQVRLTAYTAAKVTAQANGEPIPTLAEYEAAQGLQ